MAYYRWPFVVVVRGKSANTETVLVEFEQPSSVVTISEPGMSARPGLENPWRIQCLPGNVHRGIEQTFRHVASF